MRSIWFHTPVFCIIKRMPCVSAFTKQADVSSSAIMQIKAAFCAGFFRGPTER
uniref:Uncharacterized protein n=1 Tax=Arundo donax TaxID=35708 RepID=A0A0A8Z673_ARUDO